MKKIILFFIIFILSDLSITAQCWKLASGKEYFTLAIRTDSTLWAWGNNAGGQFGNGGTTSQNTPLQIGTGTNWLSLASGANHCIAIKTDGTLWAWGDNLAGELGDGTYVSKSSPVQIGSANNWKALAAGEVHSLALKTDGTLWGWGNASDGELGIGIPSNPTIENPTMVGTANNWQSIAAGRFLTLAIKTDGTLWGCGNNSYGQLSSAGTSNANYLMIQIGTDTDWQSAASGWYNTSAIKTNGTLWSWGLFTTGNGTVTYEPDPIQVGTANNWRSISLGQVHYIATKTDGTLWTWGANAEGQLGDGTNTDKYIPTQIGSANTWQSIATGNKYSMAIKTDGTLFTWGKNANSQLGDGTSVNKNSPTLIGCTLAAGVEELTVSENSFSVFPNPSRDIIYFKNTNNQDIDKVIVTDMLGRQILEKEETLSSVNIQHLQPGLYIISLLSERKNYRVKFIKE